MSNRWYHTLRRYLMVEAEDSCPRSRRITQQVFAFDIEGDAPRLKIYIMPDAKVRQTSIPRNVLITQALEATGLGTPWACVQDYLSQLDEEHAGHVEALGWDAWCSPAEGARQKAYVRFRKAALEDVLRHLDLGGRLTSSRIREIQEAAGEMWSVFLSERQNKCASGDETGSGSGIEVDHEKNRDLLEFGSMDDLADRTAGVVLAYELRVGMDEPCSVKCEYFQSTSRRPLLRSQCPLARELADLFCSLLPSEIPLLLRQSTCSQDRCFSGGEDGKTTRLVSRHDGEVLQP